MTGVTVTRARCHGDPASEARTRDSDSESAGPGESTTLAAEPPDSDRDTLANLKRHRGTASGRCGPPAGRRGRHTQLIRLTPAAATGPDVTAESQAGRARRALRVTPTEPARQWRQAGTSLARLSSRSSSTDISKLLR